MGKGGLQGLKSFGSRGYGGKGGREEGDDPVPCAENWDGGASFCFRKIHPSTSLDSDGAGKLT